MCYRQRFLLLLTVSAFRHTILARLSPRTTKAKTQARERHTQLLNRCAVSAIMHDDSLEAVLALIQRLQAVLLELKELRGYVGRGVAKEMVEELIEEGESKLAQFKRRLVH